MHGKGWARLGSRRLEIGMETKVNATCDSEGLREGSTRRGRGKEEGQVANESMAEGMTHGRERGRCGFGSSP